jgi:predicted dehydrogenase
VAAASDAASRGQVVSVISQHRFDPAAVAVSQAVSSGQMGRLTSAVASVPWWREQSYYDSAEWRGTRALDGGGALLNQGVHTLDLLLSLLGRPVEVFAYADRLAHSGIEVEDVLVAVLRFSSGALATVHATTAAYPGMGVRLQVHGTRGSAVISDDLLTYASFPHGVSSPSSAFGVSSPSSAFGAGHVRQYEDIVAAILSGRPPGVGVADGFLVLSVVEAIYWSAETGRPVPIVGSE